MAPSTRSRSVAAGKQPLFEETLANPSPAIQPILDYRPQEGGRESPTPHDDAAEPSDDDEEEGADGPAVAAVAAVATAALMLDGCECMCTAGFALDIHVGVETVRGMLKP